MFIVFYSTATSSWEAFTNGRCSSNDLQKYTTATTMLNSYIILFVNAQQAGPEYFKTARKRNLIGVRCEPRSYQINYLIDEADDVGKGADATISIVHQFFENYGLKECNVQTFLTYSGEL